MTLAGTAVATLAAALAIVGLTGGYGSPTETLGHDRPRQAVQVFVNPIPPRVLAPPPTGAGT